MGKVLSYLLDWTINLVKNRDILAKNINTISKKDSDFLVKYKDGKERLFTVRLSLDDITQLLDIKKKDEDFTIITINNENNLNIIVKNWKMLIEFKFLSIYLINPFSKLDKKWILFPYTHHKICDESSLELGLKSMYYMVDSINEEQLRTKLEKQ